jgi:citrate lyase subunit beta/citryl-CoA lyase
MVHAQLRLCRSLLFLPASNPRAIEKARGLSADMIILDCEDAVRADDKDQARAAALDAAEQGFEGRLCAIRINGVGSPWYGDDVVAMRRARADFVVVPKAEGHQQMKDAGRLVERPLLAMIETAVGVLNAPSIAADTAGVIAGTNDLSAALGLPPGVGRGGLSHSLQAIVLAARSAGVAAFDGVYNALEDGEGLRSECEEGRAFGFDGKSLIHPSQIDTANLVFGPSEEEVAAAQRLIEAATGGAERFEGRMIESMHIAQARAVLAKARR